MIAEIKAGPQFLSDGAPATLRGDKTGAAVFTAAHAQYLEPAYRGTIMEACTAAAGVAPGTALSTTPPIAIWNPPSSGKNIAILKTSMGYVSGTFGAGTMVYAVVPSQTTVPTTGTELVPQSTLIGAPRGVGRVFSGSTLAAVPTILRPAFTFGAILATSVFPPDVILDLVDGAIIVAPGTVFCMQGIATAGTTPLALLAFSYEEFFA